MGCNCNKRGVKGVNRGERPISGPTQASITNNSLSPSQLRNLNNQANQQKRDIKSMSKERLELERKRREAIAKRLGH